MAQLPPSGASVFAAAGSPGPTAQGEAERPVSWNLLAPNFLHDQKRIWTFPVRAPHGKDWKPALGVVAGTIGLMALDPHVAPYFRRTSSFTDFNNVFSGRNTMLSMVIFPASFYAVGLKKHDSYAQHTALLAAEAAADAEIVDVIMKDVSLRARPSDIAPHGNFYDSWWESRASVLGGNASFPSGHAIQAFAIATVFAQRYRRHRWVPWVAYAAASLVGFSRIPLQAHFPSDVFLGSALGYFISRDVVLRGHN